MNQKIAALLYEIADIWELKGIEWKPRAYRKAAQSIESLSEDISDIYKKQGIKGLRKIPGVGEAIAKHIQEFLVKGKVERFESLRKSIPKGLAELMSIMSLGAKRASILYKKLGIKNLSDLEKSLPEIGLSSLSTAVPVHLR